MHERYFSDVVMAIDLILRAQTDFLEYLVVPLSFTSFT